MTRDFGMGVTIREYEVRGATHSAVGDSIKSERARAVPEGHSAFTLSRIGGRVDIDESGKAQLTREIRVVVYLPRLVQGGAAEVSCFEGFRLHLEEHEGLHIANAHRLADEMVQLFQRVRSTDAFEAGMHSLQERLAAADRELDEATNHGGRLCRWPPPDCTHRKRARR